VLKSAKRSSSSALREQRLRHDLEAAFKEVVEAHVGAEEREEIVIESAGRLTADNQGVAVLDGFAQERTKGRERGGLVRDVDDEETAVGAVGRILEQLDIQGAHEEVGHGVTTGAFTGEGGDGGRAKEIRGRRRGVGAGDTKRLFAIDLASEAFDLGANDVGIVDDEYLGAGSSESRDDGLAQEMGFT